MVRPTDQHSLYRYNWHARYGPFISEHRPRLDLRGHWQNPVLVMSDGRSISRKFLPDGRV
jgi:hypothetical protein